MSGICEESIVSARSPLCRHPNHRWIRVVPAPHQTAYEEACRHCSARRIWRRDRLGRFLVRGYRLLD